jgi:hypothetical protein
MKSILTFENWTKKMSKNEKPKYFLLTEFFITILKNYGVKLNEKFIFCHDKFFIKNLKTFYIWRLYGAIGAKY